jgi:putative transposase
LKRWYRFLQEGKTFVYVDESGFAPTTERTHGYAPRGEKVYGLRSGHRRPRTSLIAARIGKALAAPMLFEGTCNTVIFNLWLAQELCPKLHEKMVVVMDNAAFHKSVMTQDLIRNTGATVLFLPPYSPDLNPIENTFGTIKRNRQNYPQATLSEIINLYENYSE